jgi:hypothetical protein
MKQKTKEQVLNEIFNNDPYGILDDTFEQKKIIRTIDKVSKNALYLFIPFFVWVFTQIIINA